MQRVCSYNPGGPKVKFYRMEFPVSKKIIGPDNPTCQLLPKAQSSEEDGMGKAGKVKGMVEDRLCERGVCDKVMCQRVVCDKVVCDKAVCVSQPSAVSATPATQSEGRCHEVPPLPHKVKVDVTKCHACHAKHVTR